MAWNNGRERKKFDKEQEKLSVEYRAAGMGEDEIEQMYRFDLEAFHSNRRFFEHTQQFPELPVNIDEQDGLSPIFKKFADALSTGMDEAAFQNRFWWIEEIDNLALAKGIKSFSVEDIELITLLVYEGYTQKEVAKIMGINQSTICRRLKEKKKILQKLLRHA